MKKTALFFLTTVLLLTGCQDVNDKQSEQIKVTEIQTDDQVVFLIPKIDTFQNDFKWGYVSISDVNTFVIAPQYRYGFIFENETAIVGDDNYSWVIDGSGIPLTPTNVYKSISRIKNHFFAIDENEKNVVLNQVGQLLDHPEMTSLYISGDYIIGQLDDKPYYFDDESELFIEIEGYEDDYTSAFQNIHQNIKIKYNTTTNQYTYFQNDLQIIDQSFDVAGPFIDGYAVVALSHDDGDAYGVYQYGVVNEKGDFLFDISHDYIENLGGAYFAVTDTDDETLNYLIEFDYNHTALKKSLYKKNDILFENAFYLIKKVDDLFYVHDGSTFFFVDENKLKHFNQENFTVNYDFKKINDVYIGTKNTTYGITMVILGEEDSMFIIPKVPISGGYISIQNMDSPVSNFEYPEVMLEDYSVAKKINDELKDAFVDTLEPNDDYYESTFGTTVEIYESNATIGFIELSYDYSFGAAHGYYYELSHYFNKNTGNRLTLEDLFVEGLDVNNIVSSLLADYPYEDFYFYDDIELMTRDERISYFTFESYMYRITDDALIIFFNPYDIGPYAAGIISMTIPLQEIKQYINFEGPYFK